jgi:hypothetical protein
VSQCAPLLQLRHASCPTKVVAERALTEGKAWTVDVPAGTYELWVESSFEADNGQSGQTTVAFGLIVDDTRARTITTANPQLSCADDSDAGSADGGTDAGR